jgi:triacylglycerol lipase
MALPKSALVLLAAMMVTVAGAQAQEGPLPADIAAKLQEFGRVVEPKTAALFVPLQQKEPYPGVKTERDVKYGPADRNLLDIFMPETAAPARPVLIFLHGGGFVAGNKRQGGGPFFDNVMLWAVKNGFVGVNATYRLAPQATWPAGAEDVGAIVKWVSDNIGERGGNPARIYGMGNSAGAIHVASYLSHPEFYKVTGGGLAGVILVSAIYDLMAWPADEPIVPVYYGTERAPYAERSSLPGLLTTSTPLMMTAAELDPPEFVQQFELMKAATCKRASGCAHTFTVPQHSHLSQIFSINTADNRLTDEILGFIKTGK